MADLIRPGAARHDLPLPARHLAARGGRAGSLRTDIVYSAEIPYEGRDILLLDDIVDTGITLNFLLDHIRERSPRSLKVCALIDKPGDRKIDVHPDWAAFTLEEPLPTTASSSGYGLDYAERYRGLPYIGTIPRPAPRPARRASEGSRIRLRRAAEAARGTRPAERSGRRWSK